MLGGTHDGILDRIVKEIPSKITGEVPGGNSHGILKVSRMEYLIKSLVESVEELLGESFLKFLKKSFVKYLK